MRVINRIVSGACLLSLLTASPTAAYSQSNSKPIDKNASLTNTRITKPVADGSTVTKISSTAAKTTKTTATKTTAAKTTAAHPTIKKASATHPAAKTRGVAHPTAAKSGAIPKIVAADGTPIWLSVKDAKIAARAKKRLIIADFYTDWCTWCKIMDKTTFRDPSVTSYLAKNFVCMKVDAQDGKDGEQLATRFNIQAFPTTMIFRPNGQEVGAFDGYHPAKEYLEEVKAIVLSTAGGTTGSTGAKAGK